MSLQKKGDIVINPKTQRPVRVGSRTWLNLVKLGIMEGRYSDPNELSEQYEELPAEEVEIKIKEINKKLPKGTQAVRGRGKYSGKLVKRNKQATPREMTEYTAKAASKLILEKSEELDEMPSEDIEAELERMILAEMIGGRAEPVRGSKKQVEHEEYYVNKADYQQGGEDDALDEDEDEDENSDF